MINTRVAVGIIVVVILGVIIVWHVARVIVWNITNACIVGHRVSIDVRLLVQKWHGLRVVRAGVIKCYLVQAVYTFVIDPRYIGICRNILGLL